jgi:hypothetical protein
MFSAGNFIFKYYFDEFQASVNYRSALSLDKVKEGRALLR